MDEQARRDRRYAKLQSQGKTMGLGPMAELAALLSPSVRHVVEARRQDAVLRHDDRLGDGDGDGLHHHNAGRTETPYRGRVVLGRRP